MLLLLLFVSALFSAADFVTNTPEQLTALSASVAVIRCVNARTQSRSPATQAKCRGVFPYLSLIDDWSGEKKDETKNYCRLQQNFLSLYRCHQHPSIGFQINIINISPVASFSSRHPPHYKVSSMASRMACQGISITQYIL